MKKRLDGELAYAMFENGIRHLPDVATKMNVALSPRDLEYITAFMVIWATSILGGTARLSPRDMNIFYSEALELGIQVSEIYYQDDEEDPANIYYEHLSRARDALNIDQADLSEMIATYGRHTDGRPMNITLQEFADVTAAACMGWGEAVVASTRGPF